MEADKRRLVWYFAYGANMSEAVLTGRRKIQPIESKVARCDNYSLSFNVMGVPYSDPAMGGLRMRDGPHFHDEDEEEGTRLAVTPVHGVAYLLNEKDLRRIAAIEGGGIAYRVATVRLTVLETDEILTASTLIGRHEIVDSYIRLPSRRYLDILVLAAKEHSLPASYQAKLCAVRTFQGSPSARYKVGKWLFDSFWQRVARQIEHNVKRYQSEQGNVPAWFLVIFDILLWTMWIYHDYLHSIIWGRGDGR